MFIDKDEIIKKLIIIDLIFQEINIKKSIILFDDNSISKDNQEFIIKHLKLYNHNIDFNINTNITKYINNEHRILIISYFKFNEISDILINDYNIDTLFLLNITMTNANKIINKFKNVILYNL